MKIKRKLSPKCSHFALEIQPILDAEMLNIACTPQKEMILAEEERNGARVNPMVSPYFINGG